MVLSTKMDSACVKIFQAVSVTNGSYIWWQDGDGDVSNSSAGVGFVVALLYSETRPFLDQVSPQ